MTVLVAGALLAGCSSSHQGSGGRTASSAPSASPRPMPAQCATWHCTKAQTVELPDGYAVTLWRAGKDTEYSAHPVVELTRDAVPTQWLVLSAGYGWSGSLTCLADSAQPSCVVIDGQGMHSGLAQELLLRDGQLVASASVSSDAPTILAADLDGDHDLDVIALDNDYTPNFAAGRALWQTYRFTGEQLISTGCALAHGGKAHPPAGFVTGSCPHR